MTRKDEQVKRFMEAIGDNLDKWKMELARHLQQPRTYYSIPDIKRFIMLAHLKFMPLKQALQVGAYFNLIPEDWRLTQINHQGARFYKLKTNVNMTNEETNNQIKYSDINRKKLIELYLKVVNTYLIEGDLPSKAATYIKALDSINSLMQQKEEGANKMDIIIQTLTDKLGNKTELL